MVVVVVFQQTNANVKTNRAAPVSKDGQDYDYADYGKIHDF